MAVRRSSGGNGAARRAGVVSCRHRRHAIGVSEHSLTRAPQGQCCQIQGVSWVEIAEDIERGGRTRAGTPSSCHHGQVRNTLVIPWSLVLALAVAACGGSSGDDAAAARQPNASSQTTVPVGEVPVSEVPTSEVPTSPPTSAAPATLPPAPTTSNPSPPTTGAMVEWAPIGPGPYDVGVSTITIDDPEGVRPLTVDVWYPLAAGTDTAALDPQRYTLLPTAYYESPAAVAATPDLIATDAPLPLVVYSHGSGGIRYVHSSYTEALASFGYLVAAPDHTGNTVFELFSGSGAPFEETAFNRPNDVSRVISAFTDPTHPTAGPYAAAIDADRVAVTGHSFGGYTAIALATGVTTSLGEIPPDERVDAIIALAPAVSEALLPDDRLAALDVPMMVLVGTDDTTTPVDPNVTRLWDLTSATPAYRVELVAGEHQTFTDLCAYERSFPLIPEIPDVVVTAIEDFGAEGCSDGDIDDGRAADITNTHVVTFLDQLFHGGPAVDDALAGSPGDVIFERR